MVLLVRSQVIDELNQQYVKTARAKGLRFHQVLFGHALRNVLIPFITLAGWEVISALAGYTVVVESVFAWPGLGLTAIQAIQRNDLFLLQAIVFTVAIAIVLVNILLDVDLQVHRSAYQARLMAAIDPPRRHFRRPARAGQAAGRWPRSCGRTSRA